MTPTVPTPYQRKFLRRLEARLERIQRYHELDRFQMRERELNAAIKLIQRVWPRGIDTQRAVERWAQITREEALSRIERRKAA